MRTFKSLNNIVKKNSLDSLRLKNVSFASPNQVNVKKKKVCCDHNHFVMHWFDMLSLREDKQFTEQILCKHLLNVQFDRLHL